MSQQIQITGGAKVRNLQDVIIGTSGVLSSLAFDVANGVPKLDSNGKILVSQLPNSVMEYKGTWNAATNTPTLANGTGNQGDVWLCTTPGTVNFGAGPITFISGDSAVYSGSIWQRSGGATGSVTSVGLSTNGGAITIGNSPITTSGVISANFNGTNLQYVNGAGNLTTFPTLMTSVGLTMPSAFTVTNSPLTGAGGTLAVTGAGYASQYIRGDGTLADFPSSGGGGSSVSYYLNGGTSQGTIGGVTYYEMSKTAVIGTGVDFTKSGDGFIVAFLTDANDPAQLNIPAGNWNYEIYASMSANGGTPQMYAELYKYDGTTFTLISTSANEIIYDGTALNLYTFAMTVPATTLALTDRLAIKLYATNSGGKTTTIHTQDSHLCQVITTFSTGITALNGLTAQVQYFQVGTSGTDFNISSTTATHTFNLPTASATNRGALSSADWSIFNGKQNALTLTTTGTSGAATLIGATLNIPNYNSMVYPSAGIALSTGTAWGTSITDNSANWNTAYTNRITSATAPLSIISNVIAMSEASGSVDGFLSRFDWTTFNNKQSALTNPVTGTGTTNYLPKFTGASAIGNSLVYDNGTSVGIGTITAFSSAKLQIKTTTNVNLGFQTGTLDATGFKLNAYNDAGIANIPLELNASILYFKISEANKMTLDASGNLGLGVTPSAWSTSFGIKVIDVGSKGTFYASDNDANVSFNQYFDGTNAVYKTTGTASRFALVGNEFQWRTAPSGTAGAAITFTQAMTLNASGQLLLSRTSAFGTGTYTSQKLQVTGGIGINSDAADGVARLTLLGNSSTGDGTIDWGGNGNFNLVFSNNGNTRVIIDGSGNTAIGYTTNPSLYKLDVNGTGRFSGTGYSVFQGSAYLQTAASTGLSFGYNRSGGNGESTIVWGAPASGFNFEIASVTSGTITPRLTITNGGNVGIGTSSPNAKLTVYQNRLATFTTQTFNQLYLQSENYSGGGVNTIDFGSTSYAVPLGRIGLEISPSGTNMKFGTSNNYSTGITNTALTIDYAGGATFGSVVYATAFYESSDSKLKKLIQDNYQTKGIASITPKLYTKNGKVELGYYAQDLVGILDSAISKGEDDMLSLSYREVLVAKVYALEQRIKELESKLN